MLIRAQHYKAPPNVTFQREMVSNIYSKYMSVELIDVSLYHLFKRFVQKLNKLSFISKNVFS